MQINCCPFSSLQLGKRINLLSGLQPANIADDCLRGRMWQGAVARQWKRQRNKTYQPKESFDTPPPPTHICMGTLSELKCGQHSHQVFSFGIGRTYKCLYMFSFQANINIFPKYVFKLSFPPKISLLGSLETKPAIAESFGKRLNAWHIFTSKNVYISWR